MNLVHALAMLALVGCHPSSTSPADAAAPSASNAPSAASVQVPAPPPPLPYADGEWWVTKTNGRCEAVNRLCPPKMTCTPRAPYECPANVPASALPISVIHMTDGTCNVELGDATHRVPVNVPCPK